MKRIRVTCCAIPIYQRSLHVVNQRLEVDTLIDLPINRNNLIEMLMRGLTIRKTSKTNQTFRGRESSQKKSSSEWWWSHQSQHDWSKVETTTRDHRSLTPPASNEILHHPTKSRPRRWTPPHSSVLWRTSRSKWPPPSLLPLVILFPSTPAIRSNEFTWVIWSILFSKCKFL